VQEIAEETRGPRPARWATLVGVCVAVVALVVAMEVRHDNDGTRPPEPPSSAQRPEARLATLEPAPTRLAGARAVKRLSTFLDILQAECPANSRRELAALSFRGVEDLRARGITARPTDVFNGVMAQQDIGRTARCGPYFERSVARLATGG
jgi:hypothetical protein